MDTRDALCGLQYKLNVLNDKVLSKMVYQAYRCRGLFSVEYASAIFITCRGYSHEKLTVLLHVHFQGVNETRQAIITVI